jgi:alkylation response protein AidB-like acyl-CoA dehydrogenase
MTESAAEPFSPAPELDEFRAVVRSFLQARSAESAVRQQMATQQGFDFDVWQQMARQLGLQGVLVPAEFGGQGLSALEMSVVLEEMGRALLCAPFLSTAVLAVSAILASNDAAAMADYLPDIASGEVIATLGFAEDPEAPGEGRTKTTAVATADGYVIDGRKQWVLDGASADLIILTAQTTGGLGVFAVDGTAAGLTRTPLPTLDLTRKQAELELTSVRGRLLGARADGAAILARALAVGRIALASEQVGGAHAVLDAAVGYAKTRIQFGVPIGSFQAIKHLCADALVSVESATSVAQHAAWVAARDPDDLELTSLFAAAYCSSAYTRAAELNIQVHGGIGFTWEHSAHLYFKRAKASELLFGSPREHRRILGDRLGL